MTERVVKRNGVTEVPFDLTKIETALKKAIEASDDKELASNAGMIAEKVHVTLRGKYPDGVYHIEDIQDCCEDALAQNGLMNAARAFIRYREKRSVAREMNAKLMNGYLGDDVTEMFTGEDEAVKQDWHVKNNASVSYSLGGLILNNSESVTKEYWLRTYDAVDPEIASMYRSGAIHIHDLGYLSGYCAGWNLLDVIKYGISGVPGKISSAPAKHLMTLCNQMVNFLGILQNEWAGAQAFSSFDTYLAPYVKMEHLTYDQVKQAIQSFVFGVNVPSRWGTQAPFSNITLDWTVPEDLKNVPAWYAGHQVDFSYGDCQMEMDMVNKAFLEIMLTGDPDGRGFAYPIPTYSITKDFNWSDSENNRLLFEMAAKYGTPYFSNYINSDMKPSDVRSMCCRLRLDLRELRRQNGGNFGAGENTGSIGVVTVNLPRVAYLAADKQDFYNRLVHVMDVSAESLDVKRAVVSKLLARGLYPYTKRYLVQGFKNHFSTIGLVGMNEACLNAKWLKKDLTNPEADAFAEEVLDFMRNKLSDYQEKYGCLFNLEATPAEATSYRLAYHDRKLYPDIITAGTVESPYYTNSSHLPVNATDNVFDALDIEDPMQIKYTSGTVFHAFLGERLSDWHAAALLVRKIAENYRLPYFTLSPTYSVCPNCGYIAGEEWKCPICGADTEVYSRITGYYRPVKNWNIGKAEEFRERKTYNVGGMSQHKAASFAEPASAVSAEPENAQPDADGMKDGNYLFTTKTCPNCKMVKSMLSNKPDITYQVIDAEEHPELAMRFGIMSVPTMAVVHNGDAEGCYTGASAIIGQIQHWMAH